MYVLTCKDGCRSLFLFWYLDRSPLKAACQVTDPNYVPHRLLEICESHLLPTTGRRKSDNHQEHATNQTNEVLAPQVFTKSFKTNLRLKKTWKLFKTAWTRQSLTCFDLSDKISIKSKSTTCTQALPRTECENTFKPWSFSFAPEAAVVWLNNPCKLKSWFKCSTKHTKKHQKTSKTPLKPKQLKLHLYHTNRISFDW